MSAAGRHPRSRLATCTLRKKTSLAKSFCYTAAMDDKLLLQRAVELAEQSPEAVGCGVVITSKGVIIAEAYNSQKADNVAVNHAEIKAIITANQRTGQRKLPDATAYCSCEPCTMCLTALSYAHVTRVVFNKSMRDLFPDDPQSQLNLQEYAQGLNFVPEIQQMHL
jgi:tRNA(Arg) A34 adenosine deaminase TadA